MSSQPFFSVIIPAYERPLTLAKAIESILVQSCQNWELLIVDDGSAEPLANSISGNYPDRRIQWFRQTNQGPAAARKLGAEAASGRFVCFLDDDDYFLPDHLDTVLDYLETDEFPEIIVRTPLAGLDPDNNTITYPDYHNDQDALLQYWKAPCGITSLVFPAGVFRKCPIDPKPRIIEDFAWVSRVLIQYPLLQLPGPATVIYVQHDKNRSLIQAGTQWAEARIEIIQQAYRQSGVSERVPKSVYHKMLLHQWCHAARQAAINGEHQLARQLFRQSLAEINLAGVRETVYTAAVLLKASINPPASGLFR